MYGHLMYMHRDPDPFQPIPSAINRMAAVQVEYLVRIDKHVLFPELLSRRGGSSSPAKTPSPGKSPGKSPKKVQGEEWAPLCWEPRMFRFDEVTFFQVVIRKDSRLAKS